MPGHTFAALFRHPLKKPAAGFSLGSETCSQPAMFRDMKRQPLLRCSDTTQTLQGGGRQQKSSAPFLDCRAKNTPKGRLRPRPNTAMIRGRSTELRRMLRTLTTKFLSAGKLREPRCAVTGAFWAFGGEFRHG